MRPDFKGFPSGDLEQYYTEEELDYDDKKTQLTLELVKDVTRDKVNFKESLKSLEIKAVTTLYQDATVQVEQMQIYERPEINTSNYQNLAAYQEWKNKIDLMTIQQSLVKNHH